MAVSPQILQMIASPTAGKLGEIGATIAANRQQALVNEAAQAKALSDAEKEARLAEKRAEESAAAALKMKSDLLDYDEKAREDNLSDSMTTNAFIERYKQDAINGVVNPNDHQSHIEYIQKNTQGITDPNVLQLLTTVPPTAYPQVQKNAQFSIDTYNRAKGDEEFGDFQKIPGTQLYGQQSSKTGKFVNIKDSLDGSAKLGNSEFERNLSNSLARGLITQEKHDELLKQRTEGLAGEMTKTAQARLTEQQQDRSTREKVALRKEYTQGAEHFTNMGQTIDSAFAAMDSGDTKLSEVLLNQVMSQVQDSNVRAFQMYGEFDKGFGNLAERVAGSVSRFIVGKRTETETEEIRNVLRKFNETYVKPADKKLRDRYRRIAIDQGQDPFQVVPPKNVDDILRTQLLDNKEKARKIKEFFPDWKPSK